MGTKSYFGISFLLAASALIAEPAFCSNKEFSATQACSFATTEILNRRGGDKKVEVVIDDCGKFSKFDQGIAQVHVRYSTSHFSEYLQTRYETKDLDDVCDFIRTKQGWRLNRCR